MNAEAKSLPVIRCAVYCRVSSDERLDQSFNSIDAQREAGAAFIASQRSEGWVPVDERYEDPGFSGGTMDRPSLKRLLQDIQDGKIDTVVVYKIDRLSRSLNDFAKMVEIFDRHKINFCSVTQPINSSTSMGKLMLNILLSFAQFEREVTGERIRDKIAASKRKGMWMGGQIPLGYRVEDRQLLIDTKEADVIHHIFDSFITCRSTTQLVKELADQGIRGKNGKPLAKQNLYKILHNRTYLGELGHKGEYFPGKHQPLITQAQWDKVHSIMVGNTRKRVDDGWGQDTKRGFLLRGMLFTEEGDLYLPIATRKYHSRKVYRYYVVNKNQNMGAGTVAIHNLPAVDTEKEVIKEVLGVLRSSEMVLQSWEQITSLSPDLSEPEAMVLFFRNTAAIWDSIAPPFKLDIVRTLIRRVTVHPGGFEIQWRYEAWSSLLSTPPHNTVGKELLEMEAA